MSTLPPSPTTDAPAAYSAQLVDSICQIIRVDGVSDVRAGLLSGADAPSIHLWKKTQPRFAEHLQRARSEFQRARLAKIRELAEREWRTQVWLAENPGSGTGLEEKEVEDLAAAEPEVSPAFVITPAQLALFQQRRAIALRAMNGE
ncbi:MAG TPA: hypothetical protein VGO11_02070 [Chthoniobacteraceae bacterium]|jgi:hypothetical protein|nr:hypothetical protein [Chthoniobacteraceae bacterium]